MRIAYIVEWDVAIGGGVLSKVIGQTRSWINHGHIAKLFFLSPRSKSAKADLHEIRPSFVEVIYFAASKYMPSKFCKIYSLKHLEKKIIEFNPEVIYYRDSSWTPGIINILNRSNVLVIEINSLNDQKIAKGGYLEIIYSKFVKNMVYKHSSAFVFVTNELITSIKTYKKPTTVIANGYDIALTDDDCVAPNNWRPQLILVVSNDASWHGIEEYSKFAALVPDFDFHLYGVKSSSNTNNLFIHGRASKEELVEIYKKMDIGVGTLALHRKGMTEACPLKVREYVGNGLPAIGAYFDTDLSGQDFYLEIENERDSVTKNLARIIEFVYRWKGKRISRQVSSQVIGNHIKEKKRLEFFANLL
jgi:hypothetical protein